LISLRENNLFHRILVEPFASGRATELRIVAGYASPRMLAQHLQAMNELQSGSQFKITVVVGMTGSSGLSDAATSAFIGLMMDNSRFSSTVRTPRGQLDVHSKVYLWLDSGSPIEAWAGSANYSRLAFGLSAESDRRDELMTQVDPEGARGYVDSIIHASDVLRDGVKRGTSSQIDEIEELVGTPGFVLPPRLDPSRFVICPLVNSRTGEVHNPGAGLNWGQPTENRVRSDSDSAYIPVPAKHREFFPPVGEPFAAYCPDGQVLVLARGQQGGKALATPASNEALGQYFRMILGVPLGARVETTDLEKFGSNCVVFEKGRGGSFYMHFYPGLEIEALVERLA
jgi:hypothetical protein